MATILPVLPLRDIVVFPRMVAPLFVGRDKSVRALEEVEKGGGEILLIAQREASIDVVRAWYALPDADLRPAQQGP